MMETRVFRRTRKTMKGISNERFNRDPQVPAEGGGWGEGDRHIQNVNI